MFISVALPMLMLMAGGMIAWQTKQQEARDKSIRLVDMVYESVSKLFDAQFLANEQLSLMIAGLDDAAIAAREGEFHDRLQAMLRYLPQTQDLFVVQGDGHTILSGSFYPVRSGFDLTDQDYFQYFRRGGAGLFVGLVKNDMADNVPFFVMADRRPSAGGRFAGVIAASVNPAFFERFLRDTLNSYDDFSGRVISLRRTDGQTLVRLPATVPSSPGFAASLAADVLKSGQASGRFAYTPPAGGDTRDVAWRRLPGVDMIVSSSVSHRAVVASSLGVLTPHLFFGIPATIALFSITLLALRRTRQAAAAAKQAEAEREGRQRAEETARQSQKMEALGQLTGGVAHDFNNLLAVILGSAELAKTRPPDKAARLLDNILHAAQRGAALTRQLLSFSRNQVIQPKILDPYVEIPRMMTLLKPSLRGTIETVPRVASDVWLVELDPSEWDIAMFNVAVNARDIMPDGGRFTIAVDNQTIEPGQIIGAPDLHGDFVRVALSDTGPGIAPSVAARAFEPFFTTKDVGRGTGLGLSQVYGFARQAGGAATIEGEEGGGTTVTLYLPRTRKPIARAPMAWPPVQIRDDAPRRILLVEDNQSVAAITAEIIRSTGCDVVHVDRARKALDLLTQPDVPFDLLLTDIVMPDGLDGLQLARMARDRLPALPIILVSGYNDVLPSEDEFRILRKPLPVEQLTQAIRAEPRRYPRIVVDNTRTREEREAGAR